MTVFDLVEYNRHRAGDEGKRGELGKRYE